MSFSPQRLYPESEVRGRSLPQITSNYCPSSSHHRRSVKPLPAYTQPSRSSNRGMKPWMQQNFDWLTRQTMLMDNLCGMLWPHPTIPSVIRQDPHGGAHIALPLTLTADRLKRQRTVSPNINPGQLRFKRLEHRRRPLGQTTTTLANPNFVGIIHKTTQSRYYRPNPLAR